MNSLFRSFGNGLGRTFGRIFAYIIFGFIIYFLLDYLHFDIKSIFPKINLGGFL